MVAGKVKISLVKDSLKGSAVQTFQLLAACFGGAHSAGEGIDTPPQSINQHKLPYAIRQCGTWLPELEARMVAAALDAASRITGPEDGKKA